MRKLNINIDLGKVVLLILVIILFVNVLQKEKQISSLQSNISDRIKDYESLRAEKNNSQTDYENRIENLKHKIDELNEVNAELSERLDSYKSENDQLVLLLQNLGYVEVIEE